MQYTVCVILALVATIAAFPAVPKKFERGLHGDKSVSSYASYQQKFEYPLKAPEGNSYDSFSGTPEDAFMPPEEDSYLRATGTAEEDMAPPPQFNENETEKSSYLIYNEDDEMDTMLPPTLSTYSILPNTTDGNDVMAFLRFLARALPVDDSYSKYLADPEPEVMMAPAETAPQSSYLAYEADAELEEMNAPDSKPKKEKRTSSYSEYAV